MSLGPDVEGPQLEETTGELRPRRDESVGALLSRSAVETMKKQEAAADAAAEDEFLKELMNDLDGVGAGIGSLGETDDMKHLIDAMISEEGTGQGQGSTSRDSPADPTSTMSLDGLDDYLNSHTQGDHGPSHSQPHHQPAQPHPPQHHRLPQQQQQHAMGMLQPQQSTQQHHQPPHQIPLQQQQQAFHGFSSQQQPQQQPPARSQPMPQTQPPPPQQPQPPSSGSLTDDGGVLMDDPFLAARRAQAVGLPSHFARPPPAAPPAPVPGIPAPVVTHDPPDKDGGSGQTERWEQDEPLGSRATIAAVLYANTMHPSLRIEYPLWADRAKQVAKLWRNLPIDQRKAFVQKARDNRAAVRQAKQAGTRRPSSRSSSSPAPYATAAAPSPAFPNYPPQPHQHYPRQPGMDAARPPVPQGHPLPQRPAQQPPPQQQQPHPYYQQQGQQPTTGLPHGLPVKSDPFKVPHPPTGESAGWPPQQQPQQQAQQPQQQLHQQHLHQPQPHEVKLEPGVAGKSTSFEELLEQERRELQERGWQHQEQQQQAAYQHQQHQLQPQQQRQFPVPPSHIQQDPRYRNLIAELEQEHGKYESFNDELQKLRKQKKNLAAKQRQLKKQGSGTLSQEELGLMHQLGNSIQSWLKQVRFTLPFSSHPGPWKASWSI